VSSLIRNLLRLRKIYIYLYLYFLLTKFYRHQPIIDYQGRIVAVLAPPPHDLSYFESVKRAGDRMKKEESLGNFDSADFAHGRGEKFAALSAGLSYGNGHTKPSWPLGRHPDIIDALLGDVDIQRLASHQDGKLKMSGKKKILSNNTFFFI